jgi:hypothetical protein
MELAWQGLEHSEEFSMRSYRWVGQGKEGEKMARYTPAGMWSAVV